MSRIVVVTTEPPPLPGWPTTGAGLRAHSLGEALRARGHEVRTLIPENCLAGYAPPPGAAPPARELPPEFGFFARDRLSGDPRLRDADLVLLQHWGVARELGEVDVPLAIDLAGPHLLERRLWGSPSFESDLLEKLAALRRADFLVASGRDQRLYFLPYLALAGWPVEAPEDPLPVIPYSLHAAGSPPPARGDRLVMGGFLLPWQDPAIAVDAALDALDRTGRGELVFVGGAHPTRDVSLGRFDAILARLRAHPRVRLLPPTSYDDYLSLLAEGGVALDLMARNAEREIAYTTRTVRYMASGLPPIHDDFSELGREIERTGAGWSFDPARTDSVASLRATLEGLLSGEIDPAPRASAALEFARTTCDPDRTIERLDAFARAPRFRAGKQAALLAFEARDRRLARLEADLRATESRLAALEGKRWVRWGLAATAREAWIRRAGAAVAGAVGVALLPIFRAGDSRRRPRG